MKIPTTSLYEVRAIRVNTGKATYTFTSVLELSHIVSHVTHAVQFQAYFVSTKFLMNLLFFLMPVAIFDNYMYVLG